ncbi:hypothetical protein Vspart_03014 [Vibrio spartinae]|uniref:Uncharacterized protein n=1 Tax=Vibrio spartinae TaxID=1918945 RepID=A0A1N6MB21_9VIBR|nr:hypothetical protein Vspart_03014 [Vibrio spartinae]SIO96613.1 hypothetical protein VSP9026_04416 [Vibrio spartinae]
MVIDEWAEDALVPVESTSFEAIGGGMYNPASLDSNDQHRVSRFALLGYSGLYS